MQLFIDFLPIVAFFVVYKLADIFVATAVLIVAVVLQSAVQWIRHRKLNTMNLVSVGLVLIFGGLTLAIHDKSFIMWKPTVVNWLFAAAFLLSQLRIFGSTPLIQRLMSAGAATVDLGAASWRHLNLMWSGYFAVLGIVNLYVFTHFDEATWVNFKLFGMLGLTLIFAVAQGMWIAARSHHADSPE